MIDADEVLLWLDLTGISLIVTLLPWLFVESSDDLNENPMTDDIDDSIRGWSWHKMLVTVGVIDSRLFFRETEGVVVGRFSKKWQEVKGVERREAGKKLPSSGSITKEEEEGIKELRLLDG